MKSSKAEPQLAIWQSVASMLKSTKHSVYLDSHRKDLLLQLDHHWKYSGSVLLCGDPGVGKTTLIIQSQQQQDPDVVSFYVDGRVFETADDILSYLLEALGLMGGPIKTRQEMAERLLQHAELEADLGRYVLVYFDHFDQLNDNSQRYFWSLSKRPECQLKMIMVADSYYQECLDAFGVADQLPVLELQPLHHQNIIRHLTARFSSQNIELTQLMASKALDELVKATKGNLSQLNEALQQLVDQHTAPPVKKFDIRSVFKGSLKDSLLMHRAVISIFAVSLLLAGVIYFVIVGLYDEDATDNQLPDTSISIGHPSNIESGKLEELLADEEVANESFNEPFVNKAEGDLQSAPDKELLNVPLENAALDTTFILDNALSDEQSSNTKELALQVVEEIEPDQPVALVVEPIVEDTPVITNTLGSSSLGITVQLMGVYNKQSLQDIVDRYPLEPLTIVDTTRNGRPWFILLYGSFENKAAAKRALSSIPKALTTAEPWIRPRKDVY